MQERVLHAAAVHIERIAVPSESIKHVLRQIDVARYRRRAQRLDAGSDELGRLVEWEAKVLWSLLQIGGGSPNP